MDFLVLDRSLANIWICAPLPRKDNLRHLQNLVCIVFVFCGHVKDSTILGILGLWILRQWPHERRFFFKKSDNIRGFDWDFRSRRNSHPSLGATMIIHWDAPPAKATSTSTPWKFNIAPENRTWKRTLFSCRIPQPKLSGHFENTQKTTDWVVAIG